MAKQVTFRCNIRLANFPHELIPSGMTGAELARSLRQIADTIDARTHEALPGCSGEISHHGSRVGSWRITDGKD